MRSITKTVIAIGFGLLCAGSSSLAGEVTEQWPNRGNRNMAYETGPLPTELTEENLLWIGEGTERLEGRIFCQPTATEDYVIVGMNGHVIDDENTFAKVERRTKRIATFGCYDRRTGELVWKFVGGQCGHWGVTAPVLVEEDRVYGLIPYRGIIVCFDLDGLSDGNDGMSAEEELAFINGKDGKLTEMPEEVTADILWTFSMAAQLGTNAEDSTAGTPLIIGDQLWMATCHSLGLRPGTAKHENQRKRWPKDPGKPNLCVLDKMTGQLLAVDNLEIPEIYHGQWSSPTLLELDGGKQVLFGDGYGILHAFKAPERFAEKPAVLEELWRCDVNPKQYRVDENGEELPYKLPKERWDEYDIPKEDQDIAKEDYPRFELPSEIIATPVVYQGKVYAGIGRDRAAMYGPKKVFMPGAVVCIDPVGAKGDITDTDHVLWRNIDVGRTQSTFPIKDGLLYVAGQDDFMYCLDAETGQIIWKLDLESTLIERSPVLADGKLYMPNYNKHTLFVLKEGREPEILFRKKLEGWPTTLGVYDNMVFLMTTEKGLQAYGTKSATSVAAE